MLPFRPSDWAAKSPKRQKRENNSMLPDSTILHERDEAEKLCHYASVVINYILGPFEAGLPLISYTSGKGPFTLGHREEFELALSCLTVILLSGRDDLSDSEAAFFRVIRETFGPDYTA